MSSPDSNAAARPHKRKFESDIIADLKVLYDRQIIALRQLNDGDDVLNNTSDNASNNALNDILYWAKLIRIKRLAQRADIAHGIVEIHLTTGFGEHDEKTAERDHRLEFNVRTREWAVMDQIGHSNRFGPVKIDLDDNDVQVYQLPRTDEGITHCGQQWPPPQRVVLMGRTRTLCCHSYAFEEPCDDVDIALPDDDSICGAAVVEGELLCAGGGSELVSKYVGDNLDSDAIWEEVAMAPCKLNGCGVASVGGYFYIIGGHCDISAAGTFPKSSIGMLRLNASTKEWAVVPTPEDIWCPTGIDVGDAVFVLERFQRKDAENSARAWLYWPNDDRWEELPRPPLYIGAVVLRWRAECRPDQLRAH